MYSYSWTGENALCAHLKTSNPQNCCMHLSFSYQLSGSKLQTYLILYQIEALKQSSIQSKEYGAITENKLLSFSKQLFHISRKNWTEQTNWRQALGRVRKRTLRNSYHLCKIFTSFKGFEIISISWFANLFYHMCFSHWSSSLKPTVATSILPTETQLAL